MWEVLIGIVAEKLCGHLQGNRLFPDEQKGCRKRSEGMKVCCEGIVLQDGQVDEKWY